MIPESMQSTNRENKLDARVNQVVNAVFSQSSDAIALLNPGDDHVFAVNDSLLRLCGFSRELLQQEGLGLLVPRDIVRPGRDFVLELLEEDGLRDNLRIRRADDHYLFVSLRVTSSVDAPDGVRVCVFRDFTAKRLLEREVAAKHRALSGVLQDLAEKNTELEKNNLRLQELAEESALLSRQAAVGVMTAGVAHSINNPLAALEAGLRAMQAELKKKNVASSQHMHELLDRQRNNVHRIVEVVQRVRAVAKRGALRPRTPKVLFWASEVARQSLSIFEGRIAADAMVELDVLDDAQIHGHREDLVELLNNLIANALDICPAPAKVIVSVSMVGDSVQFVVTDNGPGVDDIYVERLFEPFVSGRPGGTGLGLYMCREIAHRHGGDISYSSSSGAGATFLVSIPSVATHNSYASLAGATL